MVWWVGRWKGRAQPTGRTVRGDTHRVRQDRELPREVRERARDRRVLRLRALRAVASGLASATGLSARRRRRRIGTREAPTGLKAGTRPTDRFVVAPVICASPRRADERANSGQEREVVCYLISCSFASGCAAPLLLRCRQMQQVSAVLCG